MPNKLAFVYVYTVGPGPFCYTGPKYVETLLLDQGADFVESRISAGEPQSPRWVTPSCPIYELPMGGNNSNVALALWKAARPPVPAMFTCDVGLVGGGIQATPAVLVRYYRPVLANIFFKSLQSFEQGVLHAQPPFSVKALERMKEVMELATEVGLLNAQGFLSPTDENTPISFIHVRWVPDPAKRMAFAEPTRFVSGAWIAILDLRLRILKGQTKR